MPLLSATVIVEPAVNVLPFGFKTTIRLSCEIEKPQLRELSPLNSVSVLAVMVEGLIDFENVNTTCVLSPTFVAPLAGEIVTVGGVASMVFAVVNEPAPEYSELPASSVSPYTSMPMT